MSRKRRKAQDVVELSKDEPKIEKKIQEEKEAKKVSFDAYFQLLMRQHLEILKHHKEPMKKFAQAKGLKEEHTIDEFEKIFKKY